MFNLREMQASDGAAYAELARACPDTGRLKVQIVFGINGYEVYKALKPSTIGVVAEHPEHDGLVGAGVVSFSDLMLNGQKQKTALLSSLMVHPTIRRQGLAGQLAEWRVQKAREIAGDDVVLFAGIQDGNTGSILNAEKWANQWIQNAFTVAPSKVRDKEPEKQSQWTVRHAHESEYEILAEHVNQFYDGYNFHAPLSAKKITEIIANTPFDEPIRHFLVVEDQQGNLLTGITVTDTHRLRNGMIVEMPLAIKLANLFAQVIPSDGLFKMAEARDFWFLSGQEAAASYLWQMLRFMWRNSATTVRLDFDARSPIEAILNLSRLQPRGSGMLAVYSPEPIDTTRLIHPYL